MPWRAFGLHARGNRPEPAGTVNFVHQSLFGKSDFMNHQSPSEKGPDPGLTSWRQVDLIGFWVFPERFRPLFGETLSPDARFGWPCGRAPRGKLLAFFPSTVPGAI